MSMERILSARRGLQALRAALAAGLLCLCTPVAVWAQAPAGDASGQVTLNFVNAEIDGVARAMGLILRRQFVIDPRVKGQMTLYSEQPMSRAEAYMSFLAALRGLGFAVVEVEGLYKIVPEADAKLQTGVVSAGPGVAARGDTILTQIFRIQHENANNLVTILRPLISPNNTINVNPGNNSLVITDYADNLRRLSRIIAALDLPNATDVEVIPLQHAVAADVAVLVQRLVDQQSTATAASNAPAAAAPGAAQAVAGGSTSAGVVLADSRTNALLVRATNPARLALIRSIVAKLDVPGAAGAGGSNIHVVYLKNADAVRLAQVLRAAFPSDGRGGSASSGGSGTLTGAPASATGATLGSAAGSSLGSTQATAPVAATAQPSTGGFIQADPATNSLIITAPDPLYRQLRAVIDQLDSRRAQVYVETMIVEVNATKAADVGFQWQGLLGKDGDKWGLIGGTNFGSGGNNIIQLSLAAATGGQSGSLPSAGLNVGIVRNFLGTYSLAALARFLEQNVDGNILSTPNLVTLDNEEAKITIGQNVPFVTGQYANTGSSGTVNPFQTIERKDVGITLRVKPQIGENGTVRLTIYQEVSSVVNQNVSQGVADATAGLVTNKRSIESSVVVDDGQIIVLGGLMQDQFTDNRDKVPVLGDVPVLGGLFRSENRSRVKTNLMVFLRPVVMRDQDASNRLSWDRYDHMRAQQLASQPVPRVLLPVNEAPVLPARELPPPADAATPPVPAPAAPPN
ncbi:MAG: type II secretion system protein GspD [Caldimonas sp.]|uniref:type II secretion system secretin GspD n=1 Tax=Caldimonas manganoxidans TaxID=196015 RepID=UPI0003799D58|nr:MAG: type II secretion system protein GspD [Caldimonas sp.]